MMHQSLFRALRVSALCLMFPFVWQCSAAAQEAQEAQPATSEQQSPVAEIADDPTGDAAPQPAVDEAAGKADEKTSDVVLARKYGKALIIDVRGPIFGSLRAYIENRLEYARRSEIDLIILRITSPGGDMVDSLELAKQFSEIDWATIIAFVPDEAISGAAILSLGCERIYMQPRAALGDAGPIRFHGGLFEHAEEKIVSYLSNELRILAESRNRPPAVAAAMADRQLKVYEVSNKQTGAKTYMSDTDLASKNNAAEFEKGVEIPEAGQNRFLTVAGPRAQELQLCEGLFDSERQLLAALQFESINETRQTWVDQTVYILNRPLVTGFLLIVGLIALYIEFAAPGISIAGLISLSCFIIFFWSHALGGTSGWLEILVFSLGLGCLAMELFVFPGFGVFGISGILLVVVSLVMAAQDFVVPESTVQWTTLRNNLLLVLGSVVGVTAVLMVQLMYFDSIPGLNRFKLAAPESDVIEGSSSTYTSLTGGSSERFELPIVGEQGLADSVLRPSGKVRFNGRLIDVVTEGDYIDPGTAVEVIKREGNRIVVRKLT
ncbi:MAG: NfeD family protein [Pirellulales bacterium]